MQIVLFFSRVAFICNVCFALTWLLRYYPSLQQGHITSTILILGLVLAVIINIIINAAISIIVIRQRALPALFPRWLIIINFLFLIPQLILFLA